MGIFSSPQLEIKGFSPYFYYKGHFKYSHGALGPNFKDYRYCKFCRERLKNNSRYWIIRDHDYCEECGKGIIEEDIRDLKWALGKEWDDLAKWDDKK